MEKQLLNLGFVRVALLVLAVVSSTHAAPNILFAIADDQSYPYASAYGTKGVETPAFDRLADQGVLFHNAFAPAPQCSPCRAAILTGRNIWELEEAGTHGSYFPKKFPVFTRVLENVGYHVGFTGKPWSPGNFEDAGWTRNPVGDEYNAAALEPPASGISNIDYTANFETFLANKESDQPFFFWFGAKEPHRVYEYGSGQRAGKQLADAAVPDFLPDEEIIRHDVLDYALEIEWFDQHLGAMLQMLEEAGELANTIVVVTADNGMPFPSAKANLQEYGTHVPLVIAGPAFFPGGRETTSPTSLIDLAPTFLELAQTDRMQNLTGQSLLPQLQKGEAHRDFVLTGRERHSHARADNMGYPARALRTEEFLYVWNVDADRWPAGIPNPERLRPDQTDGSFSSDYKSMGLGYADIDPSPSKELILAQRATYPQHYALGFLRRPTEQLYDIENDPACVNDLASDPRYAAILENLGRKLRENLSDQKDPRMTSNGGIFDTYPRFGSMRYYPGFKKRGEYNPAALEQSE